MKLGGEYNVAERTETETLKHNKEQTGMVEKQSTGSNKSEQIHLQRLLREFKDV